ncbi:MAG: AAA family ATPase, partial [Oscillospiraceae bacterium]|nr:AAA family ATPase [Oscillospiraceae bacterium]
NVQEGNRNDTLFRYCSAQVGQGVPKSIALNAALDLNDTFNPPLSIPEVHVIVDSAYSRYEPNERTIYGTQEPPISEDDLKMPTLEDYPEEPVEWLIPEYLPKGQITLICGTGGTGKTSVWVSLLASISSGERILFDGFGDYYGDRQPMQCMFFSSEDTVENVIKGKLRKGHARMRNIHTISLNDPRFEKIQFGSKYLEKLLDKYRPALCVFDPLQAFIDGHIKMADRNAMRQTMRSLIEWGKSYGTTFLIVMHTNKQLNVWGRNRMADSADLWDIARCVWMVGDADDQGMKYLSHEKSNYGRTGKTMLFRNDGGQPEFKGWTDKKDREFVLEAAKKRNESRNGSSISDVCGAIISELADHPDGMPIRDLDELLQQIGYSAWAIKRAKAELKDGNKIRMYKVAMDGGWMAKKV